MPAKIENLSDLAEIIKAIKGPVAVIGHGRPDGDCIGAAVGLVELLKSRGVDAIGMTPDPVPDFLRFLVKETNWREPDLKALEGRTLISVDTAVKKLLGEAFQTLNFALAIDHHVSHVPFAEKYFLDPSPTGAAATCQIIAELAREMDAKICPAAATALYAGILTDTFRFMYGAQGLAFARLLETSAWIVRQGVDALPLTDRLMGDTRRSFIQLTSLALEKAEFLEEGALVLVGLNEADYTSVGATEEDREVLVNFLRSIEGVKVAALLSCKEGISRGNLRARGPQYAMNKLCAVFGGGGHPAAGGIRNIKEPLEVFLPRFKEALLLHWKTYGVVPTP